MINEDEITLVDLKNEAYDYAIKKVEHDKDVNIHNHAKSFMAGIHHLAEKLKIDIE